MSGGEFDYAYFRVNYFCEQLKEYIDNHSSSHSKETIDKMLEVLSYCENASLYMKEVECLASGDTGDDNFIESFNEISNNIRKLKY